jgi:phospho-N-acetylmuramoyl-pentapeptide-transferase
MLWADLTNAYVWVAAGHRWIGLTAFSTIENSLQNSHHGLRSGKLGLEITLSALACVATPRRRRGLRPRRLFKNVLIELGWFFLPFGVLVITGASNAVNLTDGLDGLAIVPSMIAAGCFAFIAYLAGNAIFANYLQIHHITGAGELTVFCGAMVGASLGFLWFNAPPAMVFMGDTGSLSIGAALGTISVVTKHELVLAIVGGLFVLEAVSVIVQVASFRITGRRVFRMAPLHHHFEQKGWEEPTIVIRFWIIAWILAIAGLATLKLR